MSTDLTSNVFISADKFNSYSGSYSVNSVNINKIVIKACSAGASIIEPGIGGGSGAYLYCNLSTVLNENTTITGIQYQIDDYGVVYITVYYNMGTPALFFTLYPAGDPRSGKPNSYPGTGFLKNPTPYQQPPGISNNQDENSINNYFIINGAYGGTSSSGISNGYTGSGSATGFPPPDLATNMGSSSLNNSLQSQGGGTGTPASGYGSGATYITTNNPGGMSYISIAINGEDTDLTFVNTQLIDAQNKTAEGIVGNLSTFNLPSNSSLSMISNLFNFSITSRKHNKFFGVYRFPLSFILDNKLFTIQSAAIVGNLSISLGKIKFSNMTIFGRQYESKKTRKAIKFLNSYVNCNMDFFNTILNP